jgi:glycosyltransferase involved in cell wall biosynthesis
VKQQPLISVIVPIYKIDRYLGICIESIINQTYNNLEIILVNDGSPDRCPEICDLYAQKDRRIKVVHKKNGGLVSARKAGLQIATGEYVGYVDGDDWIGSGFYESLCSKIVECDADLTIAGQSRELFDKCTCFNNSIPVGTYDGEKLQILYEGMISYGDFYKPGITTYVWNKLFKREILLEHQYNVDEHITIGEDAAVVYPYMMSCKRVSIIDNCEYHYRQREDSMLKKSSSFKEEASGLKVLYEYLSKFANEQPEKYELQRQVNDFILSICIIRSGGISSDMQEEYSPYDKDFYGKDIVIYSAGTFGQQLMNRIKENSHSNVIGWIDDDYWEYRRCCLNVDPVESITKSKFDYVLIATVDCAVGREVMDRLLSFGLSIEKVVIVHCPAEIRRQLIERYLS